MVRPVLPAFSVAHPAATVEVLIDTAYRDLVSDRLDAGTIYAWEFERAGTSLDVRVCGPLTFNEPALMLEAALAGLGIGYLLDHEVAPFVVDGRLIRLLAEWTPPFPGFHLYYSSRRQVRPILAAFIAAIRERTEPAAQRTASAMPPSTATVVPVT